MASPVPTVCCSFFEGRPWVINSREQREESGAGCPPPNSGVEQRVLETWRKLENHFVRFMSKDTLNKPHHIYILLNP